MGALRHKTFIGPTFYLQGASLNENREVIRAQAEAFVNTVGVDNVVSIGEHAMSFGPFSVVVWYRAGGTGADASPVVLVGNDAIANELRKVVPLPAAVTPAGPRPDRSLAWWVWALLLLAVGLALAQFFLE